MSITSHQIHSVVRTYGKQLRRGMRLNRIKNIEVSQAADKINISAEAKRIQVVERVASEIMFRLAEPAGERGKVEKEILDVLNADYGRTLDLSYNDESGRFSFAELDEDGEVVRVLDAEESEKLNERLVKITEDVVDRTMM